METIKANELQIGDRIAGANTTFPPIRAIDRLPKSVRVHLDTAYRTGWVYRLNSLVDVERVAK